ncbi:MAG: BrnA antitoxin family protein [Limisphaerales bacterium]
MKITYDRDKDLVNIGKHGVSLAEAEFLDWENALIWFDDREDYGEDREIALAGMGNVLFYVAFWKETMECESLVCVERPTRRYKSMSPKAKFVMNSPEEDAAIIAAALSDPDAAPLTGEQLAEFQPARRSRGRPFSPVTKIPTNLRLDPQVLDAFKATGPGWQTRINDVLREWADAHGMLER